MSSVIAGAVFIPGTWLAYLLVRWALMHVALNIEDKVALSFLTALTYLVGHIAIAISGARTERRTGSVERSVGGRDDRRGSASDLIGPT